MSPTLQSYLDDIRKSGVPVLGNILFYSVEEITRISHADMVERLELHGLGNFIPGVPRDDDTFLRVTSKIARKREPIGTTGEYENILVRKVRHEKGSIVKHIVAERVDAQNKRLSFDPVVELEFHPIGGDFTVTFLGDFPHARAMNLAREAQTSFGFWKGMLHSDSVRNVISRVIHSTHALSVRPTGGVFFVLDSHTPAVEAVLGAVRGLAGVNITPIPLIDGSDQREMLRAAYQEETVGEVIKITTEMNALLQGEPVTPGVANAFVERISGVKAKVAEYEELLGNSLGAAEIHLQAMQGAQGRLAWHTRT